MSVAQQDITAMNTNITSWFYSLPDDGRIAGTAAEMVTHRYQYTTEQWKQNVLWSVRRRQCTIRVLRTTQQSLHVRQQQPQVNCRDDRLTQSFRRRSSQPITWLTLTNKTDKNVASDKTAQKVTEHTRFYWCYVLILHCFYLTVIYLSYLPENTRTKYISKKQTTQNTAKQNDPGSVASYNARPGNNVGLFYNAPEHTRGTRYQIRWWSTYHTSTMNE